MKYRFILLSFFGIFNLLQQAIAVKDSKTILILHSYNQGLSWTDELNKSITLKIAANPSVLPDFRIEYMDTKHFESGAYFTLFYNYFISKYKNTSFDLLISTDNAAFSFLVNHRKELPGEPPVVFCGLNHIDSIPPNFTGIMEDIDIYSNIHTILQLHPDYSKLYLIIDRSITGNVIREKTIETIARSFSDLKHEYLTDYSYQELNSKLNTLKPGAVVLLLTFNIDKNNLSISYDHILDKIKPNCSVPIYGTWDFYLNKGIVGGKITRAATHGEYAADIAIKILEGKSVASIPVQAGPSEYIFDNYVLKEFGISKSQLPEGAVILNTPYSFIREHAVFFIFSGTVFILMLVIIAGLMKLFKKEKQIRIKEHVFLQELKHKSVELEHALQMAEKSNQLKTAFLTNLSHEIRTPMNAIVGFSDLLISNHHDKKLEEYVSIIRSSSSQLLSIINDIVEMSMIDTNQVSIHYSTININQTIEEICASFTISADFNPRITLKKELPINSQVTEIDTDEVKFRQILSNLLSNAIKFTEIGQIEIGYHLKNECLEFFVKDTGIGIDPRYHKEIFERFRRVNHSDISLFRGLGIGLTLSQSFVKLLGGDIWLNSEPGKGSTFFFTIPYRKAASKIELTTNTEKIDLQNLVILLCEDDANNILYFKELFAKTDTKILWAKNGKEAVKICNENRVIDLVLMDLKMPEMNGWEATKIIKAMRPELPVIAQTAHALALETNQLVNKGFDDYVTKPIRKKELFEKISRYTQIH